MFLNSSNAGEVVRTDQMPRDPSKQQPRVEVASVFHVRYESFQETNRTENLALPMLGST